MSLTMLNVIPGGMVQGLMEHLIQELAFSSSVLGGVCMRVVLILCGVWEKINAYLLNISYKISSSILFFILPRPAKHDLKFQSHVTSSKVQF